ncbi:hypothetical protein [Phycicoccus sp. Soil802]|uniref:hypothetical protein n=1 Tax=Phycicoccus sp. Soil802 TaxID=1736414 RepID=UPI00070388BF|nr:hypothetical protein [Phycicoccus sp. Soil802]KRF22080.1 hypothetical protein ASG91_17100 [Phycicoccus sp. Soil802]
MDHAWAGTWGLTISSGTVTLPVGNHAANVAMRDLLGRIATDPHVVEVRFEDRYIYVVVVESVDPAATTAHLGPTLASHDRVRVIRPGEVLHP